MSFCFLFLYLGIVAIMVIFEACVLILSGIGIVLLRKILEDVQKGGRNVRNQSAVVTFFQFTFICMMFFFTPEIFVFIVVFSSQDFRFHFVFFFFSFSFVSFLSLSVYSYLYISFSKLICLSLSFTLFVLRFSSLSARLDGIKV